MGDERSVPGPRWWVVLVLALVASGCGSGSASNDRQAVSNAVRFYSDAYLGDRPDAAHALLSTRCQAVIGMAEMSALTRGAKALYGSARLISLDVTSLAADRANVTYRYDNPAINQTSQPWVREAGGWRYDAC